jgi:uncharacterized membrane protein
MGPQIQRLEARNFRGRTDINVKYIHHPSTICLNMLVCTLLIVSFEKAGRRNTVTEMKIYLLMLLLPLMIQNILVLTKRSNKPASTTSQSSLGFKA